MSRSRCRVLLSCIKHLTVRSYALRSLEQLDLSAWCRSMSEAALEQNVAARRANEHIELSRHWRPLVAPRVPNGHVLRAQSTHELLGRGGPGGGDEGGRL